MRAVIQRVEETSVEVDGSCVGRIGKGLLVFVGMAGDDSDADMRYVARKITGLRIFEDAEGKMNLSLADVGGSVLLVSQFTLYGDLRKGRRPSFTAAAPPHQAEQMYEALASELRRHGLNVQTGQFQAQMKVRLVNDGPVTLLLDSKKLF